MRSIERSMMIQSTTFMKMMRSTKSFVEIKSMMFMKKTILIIYFVQK
ncbi:unnamed protein product [Brassica oleracea]